MTKRYASPNVGRYKFYTLRGTGGKDFVENDIKYTYVGTTIRFVLNRELYLGDENGDYSKVEPLKEVVVTAFGGSGSGSGGQVGVTVSPPSTSEDVGVNFVVSGGGVKAGGVNQGQGGRPDLGSLGNEIRNRAGSDFSKDMFENYWLGKGDVNLSQSRFNDIVKHAGAGGKGSNVILSNSQPGVARVHSFYGDSNPYALVLGRATIFYQGGVPVGFQDGYNFNWRWMWGEGSRTIPNELKTRAVSTAGFLYGAEPFNIYYGIRP